MPPHQWPEMFNSQYDCLMFGYEESKKKMSENSKGDKNGFYGKTHSGTAKEIIRKNNRKIVECPHCSKEGMQSGMNRWHFDRCKFK